MLVQEHIRQLIKLANPANEAEYRRFYAEITPVKYGQVVSWSAATQYGLARYQIPPEASFHVVLRVETYTVNFTAGAADFGAFEPPPPGSAFWIYTVPGTFTTLQEITDQNAPVQRVLDADDYLFLKGGYDVFLVGDFSASPDGDTRLVRTLVYGYNIGPELGGRLGRSEMIIPSQ